MLEQVLVLNLWALWLKASQCCQTPHSSGAGTEQIQIHLLGEKGFGFISYV